MHIYCCDLLELSKDAVDFWVDLMCFLQAAAHTTHSSE